MLTNQAAGPDVFPRRCCAPFPGYGVCSPGKRSATGEDGGTSGPQNTKTKGPVFRLSLSFTLLWQRLSPEAVLRTFSGLRAL